MVFVSISSQRMNSTATMKNPLKRVKTSPQHLLTAYPVQSRRVFSILDPEFIRGNGS